ncbi:hypothetical protein F3N42_14820 [Marinihelvus fidelis]|uniref:Isochorismatase n=1 Tax=Marinihelvus fidelis TaxID=2613842 RepID=A0A5N0T568_9GAMM|nr:hypothetical protein [Marinihelvus fidelis]KAA9129634.1 hypothetical protein F3N42_14820 [Marinihelvus fidelis]
MFHPRAIESAPGWCDEDGIKLYTISASGAAVDPAPYRERLSEIKAARDIDWPATAAFAIFHEGASCAYLVLAWWGNDNELFTSVSVQTPNGWIEDPSRFSFCLWDLEVFWFERNGYIEHLYCEQPDLRAWRADRLSKTSTPT